MKEGYGSKQRKVAITSAQKLEYAIGSVEAKALLDELRQKYGHPAPSVKEVRAMLDKALGSRTLTEELYKMREE